MSWIRAGLKVLIKRNCGMTHHAIISHVDESSRVASVEWFENGDTKGKEIEFDMLSSLNPEMRTESSDSYNEMGKRRPCRCRSAIATGSEELSVSELNCSLPLSRTMSSISLDKITSVTTDFVDSQEVNLVLESPTKRETPKAEATLRERASKKSKTVKEVERLQKNRELRRIRQAEKKEALEALLNVNSGNPNWKFQAMIKDYQNKLDFKPLTRSDEATENHQITVCVRKRPLNHKEKVAKEIDVVSVPRKNLVVVHEPKNKVDLTKYLENQYFRFDYAFDESCNNETVYNFTAKPLVQTIFDGGMATCFAYGQTGSGKTHTMSGANSGSEKGIYAMVAIDVFKGLKCSVHSNKNLVVSSSYYEIYGGKVFDLLAKRARLKVLEDGKQQVQIVGLTEKVVHSVSDVLFLIECGNNARTSGRTSANLTSSRSHAIFQITLRQGQNTRIYGRFHLIDLAGNERGADTSTASRTTRLEGAEINKSLLALKECIRALGRKGSHLPFRGSTLTLVLRDSFIGDKTKTCMIAMISPGMSSCEHTINTLRYADRVKELVNTDPTLTPLEDKQNSQNNQCSLDNSTILEDPAIDRPLIESPPSINKSNKLEHLEQEMVGDFQLWTQINSKFNEQESKLLVQLTKLGFNPVQFAHNLEHIIEERQKCLAALQDRVTAFRLQADVEEGTNNKENEELQQVY